MIDGVVELTVAMNWAVELVSYVFGVFKMMIVMEKEG